MVDSSFAGEIMKRAQILLLTKGKDALEHSTLVFESIKESGDEDAIFYWHRILRQVEVSVEENGPG